MDDHIPAPVGGMNTIDALGQMNPSDAILLVNLVAGGDVGLRTRLGYREWCTGLTGEVRSIIPFTGSKANGSTNRLFAATPSGIYDVTASSQAPALVQAFASSAGDAGYCTSCVMVTAAGHILLVTDEVNGLYTYTEGSSTWVKVVQAASTAWAPATAYNLNDRVANAGVSYICSQAGTSAASPATGPSGTGAGIVDNTAKWDYSPSIGGVDPASFCYVVVFKNRVWFVQKDSAVGWYLGINAVYGTATSFNFGTKFRAGGTLVGLYNWTYDGGNGIDDSLVAVSGGGDVAIYQGTDPATAGAFGLRGVWYVGAVPAGRQVATNFGGDLLLLSTTGILSLSRLTSGIQLEDRKQYETAKIANLFNALMYSARTVKGWSLRMHPQDNALIVTVPVAAGQPTVQLAMSLSRRSWSQYRGLPIYSSEVFGGQFYFGTTDGRVCVNTGYVDAVLLSDASSYLPIDYSMVSAFQNLGNGRQKRVLMIRPSLLSQDTPNYTVEARHGFSQAEAAAAPASAGANPANTWGTALWGVGTWGGGFAATQKAGGAAGMSPEFAIALRGTAKGKTTVVGFDVLFDAGGFL